MNRMIIRFGLALVAAIVVAGCGGGGGGGYFPPVATNPPAQAEPLDAFLAYVKQLVATALDTAEPADVSAFDPPTTVDTREPITVQ